jgi:hypothetical protein
MKSFWEKLNGHKTQIAAISGAILAWAQAKGYVAGDTAMMLAGVISVLTGIGVGHGIIKAKQGG